MQKNLSSLQEKIRNLQYKLSRSSECSNGGDSEPKSLVTHHGFSQSMINIAPQPELTVAQLYQSASDESS